jgi:hypothetical protein
MKTACDIVSFKYPSSTHTVVFVLDCHKKFDEMALMAKNILVKDGGPRRIRDTVWNGRPFEMVDQDGTARVSRLSWQRED